ncbi:glycosyltransferase family 2 protein [Pseudomonadales bacterium]|nr:glycosyltransferase family 2 protein [Pseudomonadales bacterium]
MQIDPLVSIIIPAYNAEHTILRALNSLTSQTFRDDVEVIVINDGSMDGTSEVVNNFYNENSLNWKLISQVNSGEAEARNTGLDSCKGKYILFLDADDALHSEALGLLVISAEENQCDIVFSSYRKIFSENKYLDYEIKKSSYTSRELIENFFQRRITIGIGNTLISGVLVREKNLRFKSYRAGTDNHFFRDLLRYVNTGFSVPKVLFYYYVNNDSIMTAAYSESRIDSILSVLDTKQTFLEDGTADELLASLDVFLVNEVRGNATDYLRSKRRFFAQDHWTFVMENILIYMPKKVDRRVFIGAERMVWSLSNLLFHSFPRVTLYTHLAFINLRKKFENFIR